MIKKSKVHWFEPIFFLFFGIFHLHRIWGLINRDSYAEYWLSLLESKGAIYYVLMITLAVLCIVGIVVFLRNLGQNYWWRWIYIFGGGYVLFDLFAILLNIEWWRDLLLFMFDINNPFWNVIWGAFIALGLFSFIMGLFVIKLSRRK